MLFGWNLTEKKRQNECKMTKEGSMITFRGKIKFYEAVQVFYTAEDTRNDASKVID